MALLNKYAGVQAGSVQSPETVTSKARQRHGQNTDAELRQTENNQKKVFLVSSIGYRCVFP